MPAAKEPEKKVKAADEAKPEPETAADGQPADDAKAGGTAKASTKTDEAAPEGTGRLFKE
jgi:hypothetical protein